MSLQMSPHACARRVTLGDGKTSIFFCGACLRRMQGVEASLILWHCLECGSENLLTGEPCEACEK